MNNETMLSSLVRGALNNENSREEFLKKMYDDVYALVYPVMKNKNDSKDYTEDALDYVYDNLSQINLNKNIYRQIATLVSSFLVKDLLEEANDYELKDCAYSYDNLKEDEELHNVCKNNVTAFRNVKDFKGCGKKFKKLPAVLMAMLELFGYEMRSVAEIAKLTNLSEDKVRGFLNEIRRHYGYEILDGFKAISEDTNELDGFEFIDENINPDLVTVTNLKENVTRVETAPIPEVEAITEDSEEDLELETLSVEADDDFEVDKSETDGEEKEEKKAGPIVGFFARLFPDLSVGQARIVTVALFGLVVAVVAVLVFVPLLGKDEVASDQVQVESTTEAESETETSEATTASQTKAATTKATVESTTEATKSSNSTTTSSTETTTKATEAASSNDSQDSKSSQNVEESGKESGEGSSKESSPKTDDSTGANATEATQEATTEAASN
ncbi:sigma-70 RNA polymerase sigma factor region 4 domain-containing protein [Lachnospira multipara]|uniref:sigma-70 family RNA polymerase sigma factor n=1 Tax=Lachnospira multipara TaxID=28051 RepID=UPI00040A8A40|nr:sigma-70 family RNA polymerase sigma factor [Lachnospira multipara]